MTVHVSTYSIHVSSFHLDEFSIGISFHLDEFSFGQGAMQMSYTIEMSFHLAECLFIDEFSLKRVFTKTSLHWTRYY